MRFHDKLGALRLLEPHVLVVPECACPEVLLRRAPDIGATGMQWTGLHPGKGLAVFSFRGLTLRADRSHDPRGASTLPVHVSGPAAFRLLAAWAVPPWARRSGGRRPEHLVEAFARLAPFLAGRPAAIAGDFSDTLVARRRASTPGPSSLAGRIERAGFVNPLGRADRTRERGGAPPTYFRHRREAKGNPSDSIFLDSEWVAKVDRVRIEAGLPWIRASDHAPVAVDVWVEAKKEIKESGFSATPK